jgi:hypothetical protein
MFGISSFAQASFATASKQVQVTCTVSRSSSTSTGVLNGYALDGAALGGVGVITTSVPGVGSTATLTTNLIFSKILTYVQSSVATLSFVAAHIKTLAVNSATTTSILKALRVTKSVVTSNITSVVKQVNKAVVASVEYSSVVLSRTVRRIANLSYVVTSTVSVSKYVAKTASVVSSVSAKINFGFKRTLTATVTSLATIAKTIARLVLLVTTVYTSVVIYVFRIVANSKDILYVPMKRTVLKIAGFTSVLVRPKKTFVTASKQDNLDG